MSEQEVMVTDAVVDYDPNKVYAKIIQDDNGDFHIEDEDGTIGPVLKFYEENGKTIGLTKNAANRRYFSKAKALAIIAEKGYVPLYYKPDKPAGTVMTKHAPYEKWIGFLSEEEQEEVKALYNKALEAKAADKKAPKSEVEKLQEHIAKLQAKLADLSAND